MKAPSVFRCLTDLLAILRRGRRPSPASLEEAQRALERVSETRRGIYAATPGGRPVLPAATIAEIRASTEPISALARRLGLSRPTVRKYRQSIQTYVD